MSPADQLTVARALSVPVVILLFGGLVLVTDVREKQKQITTISAIYFGLLLGLLVGWLFSMAVVPMLESAFPGTALQGSERENLRPNADGQSGEGMGEIVFLRRMKINQPVQLVHVGERIVCGEAYDGIEVMRLRGAEVAPHATWGS